jgi:Fungal specific transcription factor domain
MYLTTFRDLRARHISLSHHSNDSVIRVEAVQISPPSDETEMDGFTDVFWDPNFMAQDMLPSSLFDSDFPGFEVPKSMEPPPKSSFAQFSSRLPTLDDLEDDDQDDVDDASKQENTHHTGVDIEPWNLDKSRYEKFQFEVQEFSALLPNGCSIPAQNTLIRCLEKYLQCAQEYLPFIHSATFQAEHKPAELLLAMAALGSRYLFEHTESYELYFIAKAILTEKIRREGLQSASDFLCGQSISALVNSGELERLQTFILLIEFASWADKRISRDALLMASQLAILIRESGISESDKATQNLQWLSWVAAEERRRTLFAAYTLFNLHSIVFDTPPLILNHEIGLCLPGYAAQWRSTSAVQWKQAALQPEIGFQVRLGSLFGVAESLEDSCISSFANYLLIQGLVQEIYHKCHKSVTTQHLDNVKSFETALRRWQTSWETTQESSHDSNLDPLYAKGPLALTGAALLRLAYIRLSSGHNLSKELFLSLNPQCMLQRQNGIRRSQQVNRAVIHAAHSFSIPVRFGISFMTTTKTAIWSLEQSICSLESAILLKDWLDMISFTIASSGPDALPKIERRLLGIITDIVKGTSLASTLDVQEDYASHIQRMAGTVIKVWAAIFQGVNVLDIENVIGAGLQHLADTSLH